MIFLLYDFFDVTDDDNFNVVMLRQLVWLNSYGMLINDKIFKLVE